MNGRQPLLRDPLRALEQVEWYLENAALERLPGAFELAAGNLCRQILEQILFVLCVYSRMPREKFMRRDDALRPADQLLKALGQVAPQTPATYMELARRRGPRVGKLARQPRVLARWRRELNEPSHYSPAFRAVDSTRLRAFVVFARSVLDEKDKYLVVAAANEALSRGKFQAVLGDDRDNTPGIMTSAVVRVGDLRRNAKGGLALKTRPFPIRIISATREPRGAWPRNAVVLVQHTEGMSLSSRFVTPRGEPVSLSSIEATLGSFAKSKHQARYLAGHLRRLGFRASFQTVQ